MTRAALRLIVAAIAVVVAGCASNPKAPPAAPGAPRYPDFPVLEIPANLRVSPDIQSRHEAAWQRLWATIEPVLIVVLGIVIGGMVISLYLPIFTLYQDLGAQ